jgi:hypothetical protein
LSERRPCKGCGAPLLLLKSSDGKVIPMDLRSPVFVVGKDMTGTEVAMRATDAFVSHFATCPKANDFSKGRKR